jgi:hypothetical protein
MTTRLSKITKVIGLVSLLAVSTTASIGALAADTTNVSLTVTGGQLTIYAGDSVKDNDICTPTNITNGDTVDTTISGGAAASVVCSTAENSITLTGLTVASSRQNATATIDDILFEDLRGLATTDYTITATASNFTVPSTSKAITLGTNPDAVSSDTDADAPTGAGANKLFVALNPSVGSVTVLRDATTIAEGVAKYTKGSNTSVIDTTTPVTLLSTSGGVRPGRVNLNGTTYKLRVPALVQAGAYVGTITQTIV